MIFSHVLYQLSYLAWRLIEETEQKSEYNTRIRAAEVGRNGPGTHVEMVIETWLRAPKTSRFTRRFPDGCLRPPSALAWWPSSRCSASVPVSPPCPA